MNVTLNSQTLAAELRVVNKVTPNNPAIAILGCVLISAVDGLLTCYGTDGDLGVLTCCDAQTHADGMTAVPLPRLLAMVERFTDGDVTLVITKPGTLRVTCGRFASNLQVLDASDFPRPAQPEGQAIDVDGPAFCALASKVRYAVNPNAAKHVMRGVLMNVKDGVMAMVATDSKRLALAGGTAPEGEEVSVVLPAKALDAACDLAKDDALRITIGSRNLFFASGARLVISRVLEGQYPAYERIIPRNNTHAAAVSRVDFNLAMERVTQLTEDNRFVRVEMTGGLLMLTSAASGIGAASEAVEAVYDGPAVTFTLSGDAVTDFLGAAMSPQVTVRVEDGSTGILLEDGPSYLGVIAPVRT